MSEIFVQRVSVTWTKRSRGAEGASERSRTPKGLAWPSPDARLHDVSSDEHDGFELRIATARTVPSLVADGLSLRQGQGRLTLLPQVDPFGMPQRHRRPPRAGLSPGEWLRWSINYRFGLDHGWTYKLITWNVAYLDDRPGELFLTSPTRSVDELGRLL